MGRKLVSLCCVVVLLTMVVTGAFASTWFCPDCGKSNTGNFCYNCGAKRPEEAVSAETEDKKAISNLRTRMLKNGDVELTWNAEAGSAPFTVSYQGKNDSGELDSTRALRMELEYLIPNETYTITVSSSKGKASMSYTVPMSVFTDYSTSKKIVVSEKRFSISEIDQDKTKQFEFQVHYPQLRAIRSYKAKLVVKTPKGYGGYVWVWSIYDLLPQYDWIYTNMSMYEFLEGLKADFDEVPRGRYIFEFYFDGQLYATDEIDVVR